MACSGSLSDLVDVAVFTVRLAFRTGTIVGEVSQQLDTEEVSDKAWSMSVSGAAREVQLELQTVQDHLVGIDTHSLNLIKINNPTSGCSRVRETLFKRRLSQYMRGQWPAFSAPATEGKFSTLSKSPVSGYTFGRTLACNPFV